VAADASTHIGPEGDRLGCVIPSAEVGFGEGLREAGFRERPNRFLVLADPGESTVEAHLPDPAGCESFCYQVVRSPSAVIDMISYSTTAKGESWCWRSRASLS